MHDMYVEVTEVMQSLGVSRGMAYKIIRRLNGEQQAQGYIIVSGKCSRKYFNEKFYGFDCQTEKQISKGETE